MFAATRIWAVIAVVIGAIAFWAGMEVQKARYNDVCLDLGGGWNPAGYPICVVEEPQEAQ